MASSQHTCQDFEFKNTPTWQFVVRVCKGCNAAKRIPTDCDKPTYEVCRLINECLPHGSVTCECGGIQRNEFKMGEVASSLFAECVSYCKQRLYIYSQGVKNKNKARAWDKKAARSMKPKPELNCQCGGIQKCTIKTGQCGSTKFVQCNSCNERLYLHSKGDVTKTKKTGKRSPGKIGWHTDKGCPCCREESQTINASEVTARAKEEQRRYAHGDQSPRTRVVDISTLKPGDHVVWKRPYVVWHHAIVIHVDDGSETFTVVEYTGAPGNKKEFGAFARVEENTYSFPKQTDPFYRYDYELCLPADETIDRANSRLGEQKYNIFELNCEDLARWCKTGVEWCSQRESIGTELIHRAGAIFSGPVGEILESVLVSVLSLNIARKGAKEIASQVVKEIAKTSGRTVGRRIIGSAMSGLGALLFESALFGMSVKKAWKACKDGRIEEAEFWNEVGRSGCKHVGAIIGGVGLGLVGFLIPVPFLGTIIFGLIGRTVGALLGGLIGSLICGRKDALE